MAICKITNKGYTGKTIHFSKRIREHRSDAFNIKYKAYNSHFYRAIRKYGWDNFEWKVLQDNIPEQYLLDTEKFYIFLFGTFREGYNDTEGGDQPPSQLGKKNPNVSRSNGLRIGKKHPLYGQNIAEKIRSKNWKIIRPDGSIEIIRNLTKYCKENNLQQSLMGFVAKGRRNHHKGYKCQIIEN